MRSAPPGSVPWAQGAGAYIEGAMAAGRIEEVLAMSARLAEIAPAPEAVGKMALVLLAGVCVLDAFGQVSQATALEQRFFELVTSTGDREPIARFWWNVNIALRAAIAHDDPWTALQHSDAIEAIYDVTGGERILLNLQLYRGMNLWFLGAAATAERTLGWIVAADETLGVVSSLRRFILAWLLADRGAFAEARALATQLAGYGRAQHLPLEEGRGRWVLAEVLRRAGDLDGAEREVTAALEMAIPLERPGVLATLAMLRLAQGRTIEARGAAEDAVERCAAMGGCGMFRGAFVRLARVEALHATGALSAARAAIADASARLLAVAERIPDPLHRRRFLEEVPENAKTIALARAWIGAPIASA
jgi:tetratricopeptide (TPR) repeat protein